MTLRKEFVWNESFWTPDELGADLALWLDAEDTDTITLNGSNVAQWDDKSGNGNHATQAIAASQPAYGSATINGVSAIDFVQDALDIPVLGGESDWALFQIAEPTVTTPSNFASIIASSVQVAGSFQIGVFDTNLTVVSNSDANVAVNPTIVFGAYETVPLIFSLTANGSGTNGFLNGALADSTAVTLRKAPLTAFRIGTNRANSVRLDHKNGELVFVLGAISDTDRQRMEGYLAWKWGLVANLPVSHPYKIAPPQRNI